MTVEIVYETHAITEDNENGIATGRLPGRLSERGRAVAVELGERRRDDGIAAVFTSDLDRAVDTARIAFAGVGIPMFQDRRLRECDYGDFNGRKIVDIPGPRARYVHRPFPGGQSYEQVIEATREFLSELAETWDGERVLIIAHSANRYALQALLDGARIEDLTDAPFTWRPGWEFTFTAGEPDGERPSDRRRHADREFAVGPRHGGQPRPQVGHPPGFAFADGVEGAVDANE
jgi:broad specificity phosphatase PhoE